MGQRYVSESQHLALDRRVRAVTAQTDLTAEWAAGAQVEMTDQRSAMALGVTTAAIAIGGSLDVIVSWPANLDGTDCFSDAAGNVLDYDVDIIPTGLLGKGMWQVQAKATSTVTVRVAATVLIAVGTQFIVFGRTKFA